MGEKHTVKLSCVTCGWGVSSPPTLSILDVATFVKAVGMEHTWNNRGHVVRAYIDGDEEPQYTMVTVNVNRPEDTPWMSKN